MIRVLIAEDSVTVRELLQHVLAADPEIAIAGTAKNGLEAVEMTRRLRPDVVTMDVNMPVMNGFEATKRIMIETPTPIVIISASVDVREVSVSMAALHAGALALLDKPSAGSLRFDDSVRQLVSTVKAMAGVKVVRHRPLKIAPVAPLLPAEAPPPGRTRIVAIAASTGGPAALGRILSVLPAQFPIPILVVQHMSKGFLAGLASWLNTTCALKVRLAVDGDSLTPSTVFLADDGRHLGVTADFRIKLEDGEPIGGFRPSANHLFSSVGAVFGPTAVAFILTGMGRDGVEGLRRLHAAGGRVFAQDEGTSVIFGMPRAAIEAGVTDKTLPLSSIGSYLARLATAEKG